MQRFVIKLWTRYRIGSIDEIQASLSGHQLSKNFNDDELAKLSANISQQFMRKEVVLIALGDLMELYLRDSEISASKYESIRDYIEKFDFIHPQSHVKFSDFVVLIHQVIHLVHH